MIFKKKANKVTIEDAQLSMTPEQLEKHGHKFAEACNKYKRVGIDTETTGLSWLTDRLLMISMATGPLNDPRKHRWVFPINSWGSTILYGDARNAVQKILDIPKCIFFLHNAKFDMHFLANIGVDWAGKEIHDTCVQGFMIDTSKAAKLKVRVREEFGEDMEEFKDKFKLGGIKKLTLEDHPLCEVAKYSALDPEKTLQLANKFYLPEKGERYIHSGFLNADDSEVSLLYDRIEAKMVPLLFRMERRGIKFDKRAAIKKSLEIGKEIQNLQKAIYGEAGAPFNINSWQQLKAVYKTKGHNLESTNETVLKELSEDGDKLAGLILKYRENKKIKSTYLDALCDQADKYDRIHTSFNLHIAETGRLCLRAGSGVWVVPRHTGDPVIKQIQDVKIDDLVYTYDENRNLTIRSVLWSGKTGRQKLVRVWYWDGNFTNKLFLDVTPNHPIRLTSGEYCRADHLKEGDRVMGLSRYVADGYYRLNITGLRKQPKEHRFIYEQTHECALDDKQIHHIDGDKLNNALDNLEIVERDAHAKNHWDSMDIELKQRLSEEASVRTARLVKEGRIRPPRMVGPENPMYKHFTKFQILRGLVTTKGKLRGLPWSDTFIQKKCRKLGFHTKEVRFRYDLAGRLIPRGKLTRVVSESSSVGEVSSRLNLSFYQAGRLMELYGLELGGVPNNHVIIRVENINEVDDVYDIEVEDTHNFIANEICVHNSSSNPNL